MLDMLDFVGWSQDPPCIFTAQVENKQTQLVFGKFCTVPVVHHVVDQFWTCCAPTMHVRLSRQEISRSAKHIMLGSFHMQSFPSTPFGSITKDVRIL